MELPTAVGKTWSSATPELTTLDDLLDYLGCEKR
jgi:hypothetical protein